VRIRRSPEESLNDPFKFRLSAEGTRSFVGLAVRSDRRLFSEEDIAVIAVGWMDHSLSTSSTNALTFSDRPVEANAAANWRKRAVRCSQSRDTLSFNGDLTARSTASATARKARLQLQSMVKSQSAGTGLPDLPR